MSVAAATRTSQHRVGWGGGLVVGMTPGRGGCPA